MPSRFVQAAARVACTPSVSHQQRLYVQQQEPPRPSMVRARYHQPHRRRHPSFFPSIGF